MKTFNPDFSKYKLVVIDYNGDSWSERPTLLSLILLKMEEEL